MTQQRGDSEQLSSSYQGAESGDFDFEIDSLLQYVGEFGCDYEQSAELACGFGESGPPSIDAPAAARELTGVKWTTGGDASLVRDEEVSWASTAGTLDTLGHSSLSGHSLTDASATRIHSPNPASSGKLPVMNITEPVVMVASRATRSSKRQRDEIEHLRASVDELQIQLEALLGNAISNSLGHRGQMPVQTYLHESLGWKRAAATEQQQAERGAMENRKLRVLMQENALICNRFNATCAKFRASRVPDASTAFSYVDMERPAVVPDLTTFEALRQGLDAQYQSQPTVWEECNFTNAVVETMRTNKLRSHDSRLFFEHTTARSFPFSMNAVSNAFWRLTKRGLLTPSSGELKICRLTGNAVYATLNDSISLRNMPVSKIRTWLTMKRFIEDDQVVVVWHAKVEIQHASTVRLTERGWNVTRGLIGSKLAPCIVQTCIRSYSDPEFSISRDEMAVGSMTWKVVSQYHENMSMLGQKVENVLLDDSIASGAVVVDELAEL